MFSASIFPVWNTSARQKQSPFLAHELGSVFPIVDLDRQAEGISILLDLGSDILECVSFRYGNADGEELIVRMSQDYLFRRGQDRVLSL